MRQMTPSSTVARRLPSGAKAKLLTLPAHWSRATSERRRFSAVLSVATSQMTMEFSPHAAAKSLPTGENTMPPRQGILPSKSTLPVSISTIRKRLESSARAAVLPSGDNERARIGVLGWLSMAIGLALSTRHDSFRYPPVIRVFPSGEKLTAFNCSVVGSRRSSRPEASRSRVEPSGNETARLFPSGQIAMQARFPLRVRSFINGAASLATSLPSPLFHKRMVPSSPSETSVLASLVKDTLMTRPVWPLSVFPDLGTLGEYTIMSASAV